MALTRKYLKELGIEPEKIDLIIEGHTEVTEDLKAERESLKAKLSELESVKAENAELKKHSATDEELQTKYEALEAEYKAYKESQTAKETLKAKQDAFIELLKEANVSENAHAKALKLADFDGMTVKDGKLENADEVTKYIKTEWADFIKETGTAGADTKTPPFNEGSNAPNIPTIF